MESDLAQLEFRTAAFLAQDKTAMHEIDTGFDVHSYTAKVISDAGQPTTRQEAKAHTFKPLYGGVTGTDAQKRYYNAFKDKYSRITEWQEELQREAVENKLISLPSGREYHFPGTTWTRWGTATNRTAICNYPVQGFATADLLPCALIFLHKALRQKKMETVICNTVHDSIVLDAPQHEETDAIDILEEALLSVKGEIRQRYAVEFDMPIDIEIKKGRNWLDTEVVNL